MSDWILSDNDSINTNNDNITQSVWQLADSEPQEEGFWNKLPRNIAIGLTHAGRNLHNLPHNIVQGLESATRGIVDFNKLPGSKFSQDKWSPENKPISSYLPYDTNNYSDVFGQRGVPSQVDQLIQKGTEYAPDVIGGINALRAMKILPYLTRRGASKKLRKAQQLGIKRNIGELNVNPELIEDTRQFLPNTLPYRNLIDEAKSGDYQKLFNLQSDVGKESAHRAKDIFSSAQRSHGRAGFKSQNALLDDFHKAILKQGHLDISELMREGRNDYRRYSNFKPYRNALGIAAAAYALPKNALIDLAKKVFLHKNE